MNIAIDALVFEKARGAGFAGEPMLIEAVLSEDGASVILYLYQSEANDIDPVAISIPLSNKIPEGEFEHVEWEMFGHSCFPETVRKMAACLEERLSVLAKEMRREYEAYA